MWIFSRNDNSPIGFEIEPLETFKVLEAAEREGREMMSIFHSHINCPPYPSSRDFEWYGVVEKHMANSEYHRRVQSIYSRRGQKLR